MCQTKETIDPFRRATQAEWIHRQEEIARESQLLRRKLRNRIVQKLRQVWS